MSEASAHICLSTSRFRELLDQGVVAKAAPGAYDLQVVREAYIKHLRKHAAGHGAGGAGLASERAALAREQTYAVQIKNAALRGDLVSLETFARKVDVMNGVIRERVLSVPGKAADACAMRTREEIDVILRDELNEALGELSNPATFRGRADRGSALPIAPDIEAAT